ncbi:Glycosyltransferase involved in cell wall bisynthesis [Mesorhizobium albiziae]|uniref:Glycosyltransferase involved in cell wall bisynthesis n=1 Tax=Neomesorhizobium albiziae TaxID=335020 RepID=A0A1I4EQA8_9HYPH|nr:glycosyltransferase [Mesorhizobium albiziae]GLS31368.1 glycosyl transferase family 1 [Mesorhizobium albiziae]SFL06666.1 Glycosyltransferase involved in cell wall bisynthesis [Mesorhizobium albiziae]
MDVPFGKSVSDRCKGRERDTGHSAGDGEDGIDILLASGTPHLPQETGGLQVNTHELALELNACRISTAVLAKLSVKDAYGARAFVSTGLRRDGVVVDKDLGYRVFRSRNPWGGLRGMPSPTVVIVQNGRMVEMATSFENRGVPAVAYFHGLDFERITRPWPAGADLPFRAYIANSRFTAKRAERRLGVKPAIVPPVFRPERYQVISSRRFVTFINPVPEKGMREALAIAALCPDIPFLFVKAWQLSSKEVSRLERAIERLPNVELVDRTSNMRTVYAETKILLAPSQWEETWGRVATEAHYSGIPVLASRLGGLPEAVGPGGILVDPAAPAAIWVKELQRMWRDDQLYGRLASAASDYSKRCEITVSRQIETLLSVLEGVVKGRLTSC